MNYAQLAPVRVEAIKELKAELNAANTRAGRADAQAAADHADATAAATGFE